jgi:hypothetical protein
MYCRPKLLGIPGNFDLFPPIFPTFAQSNQDGQISKQVPNFPQISEGAFFLMFQPQPRYDNARVAGSARASRSITPLQINQLEIGEMIRKRANYIPMHSKVIAVAIFYHWTGNPSDGHKGQRCCGRKSKWAKAAGVGCPRRDQ